MLLHYLVIGSGFGGHGLVGSPCMVRIVVDVLHESEKGELIEEDLRDLDQQILPAVLQCAAHKLTQRLLTSVRKHTQTKQ